MQPDIRSAHPHQEIRTYGAAYDTEPHYIGLREYLQMELSRTYTFTAAEALGGFAFGLLIVACLFCGAWV